MSAQELNFPILPVKNLGDSLYAPPLSEMIKFLGLAAKTDQNDSIKLASGSLMDQVQYKAKDLVRMSQKDQKIYLTNEAEIYYQDTELKAGIIVLDYAKNEVYAGRLKDTLGVYTQLPFFKQGSNEVTPDSIRFNFDTEKAIIWNSRTEQSGGFGSLGGDAMKVYAQRTKKENDSVYFMSEGKITTSKDTIDPDYYIRVRKAKFVPGKKVIAGLSNLYIVDVPTPIALPFAYFPLTTGRSAGVMMPTFGNDPNRGYFLQNGGYYLPISDYVDLTLTGDLYANGSYGFRTQSVYAKRYRFRGNLNFRYENLVRSQKGFDDYSRTTIYNIQMSHSQDAKANPNSRFSASVNLGSSQYFRNSLVQQNLPNTQVNNLSSSISFSKTFPAYPSVNMSLTATHNQNTNTDAVDVTLPTFQGSMERIFPFAKREGIKKGAFQNINFQYDVNARNSIKTTTEDFLTGRMFDNSKMGARHRIPLSTNFKVAKYFSVTAGGSYEEIWTWDTYNKRYDENGTVVTDTINGFDRFNQYSLSASIGTTLYGTFTRNENRKLQAIRHVVRPSVSYGWAPSFDQYYEELVNETTGQSIYFTRFQNTLYGTPRQGQSSSMSFSIANTLEAKVRDKDSTKTVPKKIFLLNSLNLSSSYNLEADSLKLSPVSLTGGTNLLNNKMSVNFGANLDPYGIDANGKRINTLNIETGGSLLRLTNARLNISYNLGSKDFAKDKEKEDESEQDDPYAGENYVASSGGRTDDLFGRADNLNRSNFDGRDEDDVQNPAWGSKIPWDLRLQYAANYSNTNRDGALTNHVLMFSGNIELSPRWDLGISSSYDFVRNGFGITQLRFARDLKSFRLNFDWTPFGQYERWYFFIGIKASTLKDLKWESRSQRSNFN